MSTEPMDDSGTPHLTPASLVGQRFGRDMFAGISTAVVGFCPRPEALDKYEPQDTSDQYFIHVPPTSVQICGRDEKRFLSLSHVYGGPVASALIEELSFYGINYVLAYGLAGGLGTKSLRMGDFYLVERALVRDGTTPHYTDESIVHSDGALNARIKSLASQIQYPELIPVQAMTSDAIYREFDSDLVSARVEGCDIVNCDSSHLFAVSRRMGLQATQCGVISDVTVGAGEEWDSTLSAMLAAEQNRAESPLSLVGKLIEFYVEILIPDLLGA